MTAAPKVAENISPLTSK